MQRQPPPHELHGQMASWLSAAQGEAVSYHRDGVSVAPVTVAADNVDPDRPTPADAVDGGDAAPVPRRRTSDNAASAMPPTAEAMPPQDASDWLRRSDEERDASERWRIQLASRSPAGRIVRDDLAAIASRVSTRSATPIEFDAYWFARAELERHMKAGLDWSQARQDSDLLDRLPRVRAQTPQAPLVLLALGTALATFRRTLLQSGHVLPFRQLRPDLEDEQDAAEGDTWLRVPCVLPDHEVTRNWAHVPSWLQQDQPALDVRWADGGPASRRVELDADLPLMVRRQQHDLPLERLLQQLDALRQSLAAARKAGLWSVPDRWCRWQEWLPGANVPDGYFSEVLASPLHTMDFISAHRPLLVNLEQIEPDELLDAVQAPTRRMLQHWQAIVDDQQCLQAWLESDTPSPPLHRFSGRLRHHDAFASITRLDQEVESAVTWLQAFGEAAAEAVQSLPSALTSGVERAEGAQRARFLRSFRDALFVRPGRWPAAGRGESGALERQTQTRISRIAHSFPQLPTIPDPVLEGRVWCVIGAVPVGMLTWIGTGLLVLGVLAGAGAGLLARHWARAGADARVAAIKVPSDAVDIALRWARLGGARE